MSSSTLRWLAILAVSLGQFACSNGSNDNDDDNQTTAKFLLQVLHAADQEAGAPAVDDAPRFSAILKALRDEMPESTLALTSGDVLIPGPFLSAGEDESLRAVTGIEGLGHADIIIQNALGFRAAAFGNHEFDLGPGTVDAYLESAEADDNGDGIADRRYPGAGFPYLSANLDFSTSTDLAGLVTADGQFASQIAGRIAKSTVIAVKGEPIGIVGATTPSLDSISSPGDVGVLPADATDLDALAAIIQTSVDALTATGINKVILLAHMQQISIERQLAGLLRDVDIIIAGGSNTILADTTDRLRAGDSAADTYPVLLTSASNQPVALINTDGNYRYVGRLVVEFDDNGLLLADSIDPNVSGAYATDEQGIVEMGGPEPIAEVAAVAKAIGDVLISRESNTFGKTDVYLDGLRANVRTQETNLGDLSADANLFVARQFDATVKVSIKNGGGIRDDIGEIFFPTGSNDPNDLLYLPPAAVTAAGKEEGEVSQFDIQNALRFNNELSLLTLSAAELKTALEHGVAATEPGATPGRFPQVAGIRFSFDPSLAPRTIDGNGLQLTAGERIRSAALVDDSGNVTDVLVRDGVLQGDPDREIRIVTLNFLAGGGDDYPFDEAVSPNRIDLVDQGLPMGSASFADAGSEQDALAEYLTANFTAATPYTQAETPPDGDLRIQNLSARSDTVLP
ncbi:MAG: bifunctional metallophosphatase/5'-nucleotidase [Chromatiales bacterium]|nr:bifunctional metallophosphatase/5'-nucleotidase [Chromatiales bacterium]